MSETMRVFDRNLVRQRRDRAAPGFDGFDFLVKEAADRLVDRMDDVLRRFDSVLDLGCHTGQVAEALRAKGAFEHLVQCDLSPAMVKAAAGNGCPSAVVDEEWLPFKDASFDLVVSCLSLHWVNDLPGALVQIRRVLKPEGLFLAVMLGGDTLKPLRDSLSASELENDGGVSPRVSPFADVRDVGQLLQRAGFSLPVADSDRIVVRYVNPMRLLSDLRGMGETNAVLARRKAPLKRQTLMAAMAKLLADHQDADGRVPIPFELVGLTGWAS